MAPCIAAATAAWPFHLLTLSVYHTRMCHRLCTSNGVNRTCTTAHSAHPTVWHTHSIASPWQRVCLAVGSAGHAEAQVHVQASAPA